MYLLSLTAPFLHRKTISVWISSPSFFQNQISMVQRFPHQRFVFVAFNTPIWSRTTTPEANIEFLVSKAASNYTVVHIVAPIWL
ncbi:hypothetical protein E1A91_A01G179000v1 [Gossypium mustelinum]|uniref:Uncharacterized protein n=1 Tax=Gossypium mustelinum TaxID=34275 RepID=A0A5D3AI45_GOSMU|nr:hypothetical protein E1A91_A01G179000v1 [Gossypium mustelinum]TYJ50050.1 hypothetical protein E1A91_A01G179000v1 [Gossypium mustelinum]